MPGIKVIDESVFMRRCEGDKDWPFWERCATCRYCREIRVQINKMAVFRQNLYLKKDRHSVFFDLKEGIEFPISDESPLVNKRTVKELVCIAGRPREQYESYANAFRVTATGSCWQQGVPDGIKTLCGHCGSNISREGAVDIPDPQKLSYRGRVIKAGKEGLEAVGKRGSHHRLAGSHNIYVVVCATERCGTVLFTQKGLDMEGGEEEREAEPSYSYLQK